jgi:hypothetical protein
MAGGTALELADANCVRLKNDIAGTTQRKGVRVKFCDRHFRSRRIISAQNSL